MNEPNLMTGITYNRLLKELKDAKDHASKRNLAIGAAAGPESDWHDNAAYDFAHTQYDVAAAQLGDLKAKFVNCKIIKPRQETDIVALGNTVVIQHIDTGREEKYTILGPDDYGTRKDWISFQTPLANNILGKKEGKIIEGIKILKILPGEFEDTRLDSQITDIL